MHHPLLPSPYHLEVLKSLTNVQLNLCKYHHRNSFDIQKLMRPRFRRKITIYIYVDKYLSHTIKHVVHYSETVRIFGTATLTGSPNIYLLIHSISHFEIDSILLTNRLSEPTPIGLNKLDMNFNGAVLNLNLLKFEHWSRFDILFYIMHKNIISTNIWIFFLFYITNLFKVYLCLESL